MSETLPEHGRRTFMAGMAGVVGTSVLAACGGAAEPEEAPAPEPTAGGAGEPTPPPETASDPMAIPAAKPADWDPIAFNRARGNAGAIPESYRDEINGPEGETGHLGKHLPYVPGGFEGEVPEGMLPIMWGDPDLGYVRHPNAVPSEANDGEGHWYDWVRIRKATEGEAEEVETTFTSWPAQGPDGTGAYAVLGGGDITAESGKNTVYLVRLPSDVGPGDTVRVHAHCLTHGEYVDFLTLPG
jgi:hypothetical protein